MKDFPRANWVEKQLGEVVTVTKTKGGTKPLPYVGLEDISSGGTGQFTGSSVPQGDKSTTFEFGPKHLLYGRLRPYLNKVYRPDFEGHCSSEIFPLLPDELLDRGYLFHWITSDRIVDRINSTSTGARMPRANVQDILQLPIPLPPLEEQQRIVAVLDEAFEGLARARAHAEINRQNARELFESALNKAFHSGESNWRTLNVIDTLTRTKVPAKIQRKAYLEKGDFPIVSQEAGLINGYWNDANDVIHLQQPVVVFGDHTRALKYVDFDFVVGADGTQIMAPIECLDPRFYYYALKTIDLEGKGYARHFSHLKKCEISFPTSIEAQQDITSQLDELSSNTHDLEKRYTRVLQDLNDLRQSLVQKAFGGELT